MIPAPEQKANLYRSSLQQITAIIENETDTIAIMSSVVCVLKTNLPFVCWVGFYRGDPERPEELVLGPFQGSIASLRVLIGQGVCGTCADVGLPVIIPDLRTEGDPPTSDSLPVSEIALPVFDHSGSLCAVLNLDSPDLDAFQDEDCEGLEAILEAIRTKL